MKTSVERDTPRLSQRPGAKAAGQQFAPLFLIALFVVLAHYTRILQYGLYEDDYCYWGIAPHLYEPLHSLWNNFVSNLTTWPTGRPLNYFLPAALGSLGSRLGGLRGAYALAAAWLVGNGVLVYFVVRRLASPPSAVVAALAYVVFPADTTKILLVHAAHIQGAMTFLLAGMLLWLRGGRSRTVSYPIAALALLSYETAFLPFLLAPWFDVRGRYRPLRRWVMHLGACGGIVAVDAILRVREGDSRAIEAAHLVGRSIYRMTTSMVIGPYSSAARLFTAVPVGWRHFEPGALMASLFAAGAFLVLVRRRRSFPGGPDGAGAGEDGDGPEDGAVPLRCGWLLSGAALVWLACYALTLSDYSYPPTQTMGRLTSTHVAAGWPACLAIAALYEGALRRGTIVARAVTLAVAAWLCSMVAYHQYLQREYARAWEQQRSFWRQVMRLAPEAGPGFTVIVDGDPPPAIPAIHSNSWADFHVFHLIFSPGPYRRWWEADPGDGAFAHLGVVGYAIRFRRAGERVEWTPQFWAQLFQPIDPSRLVLLRDHGGSLRRVGELSTTAGLLQAPATPPVPTRTDWPRTPVAKLLFPEQYR